MLCISVYAYHAVCFLDVCMEDFGSVNQSFNQYQSVSQSINHKIFNIRFVSRNATISQLVHGTRHRSPQ